MNTENWVHCKMFKVVIAVGIMTISCNDSMTTYSLSIQNTIINLKNKINNGYMRRTTPKLFHFRDKHNIAYLRHLLWFARPNNLPWNHVIFGISY